MEGALMKISKRNLCIYIVGLAISLVLLGLYFINPNNPWCIVSCSIGASGLGAVILAGLIEDSNNRKVINEKKKTRDCIISPLVKDLTHIICMEALIVEQENEEFKNKIQDKTLDKIIEELDDYYVAELTKGSAENLDKSLSLNETNQDLLKIRLKVLNMMGGLFNYATNDIYFNRSYNISYDLFTDTEIEHLKMIQINLDRAKGSETYAEYVLNYLEFLSWIDCYDETKLFFNEFTSIKKTDNGFIGKDGNLLFIGYRSLINKNEI